jgi:hypothetical protein
MTILGREVREKRLAIWTFFLQKQALSRVGDLDRSPTVGELEQLF